MLQPRSGHTATLLRDGNVLGTGGGGDTDSGGSTIKSEEIFDAATFKFRNTGAMHFARIAHTATLLADGRVLIAGGRGSEVNNQCGNLRSEDRSVSRNQPHGGTALQAHSRSTARSKSTDRRRLGCPRLAGQVEQRGNL
jgi:hypothetical protein